MDKTTRRHSPFRWLSLTCIIIVTAAVLFALVAALLFAFDVTQSETAVILLCIAFAIAVIYMVPGLLMFLYGEEFLVEGIAHSGSVKG